MQLLLSLQRQGYTRCTVYDLGLKPDQKQRLIRNFAWVDLRQLPPGPPHIQDWSNFAWKPTVLVEIMRESSDLFLWLDSACVLVGTLDTVIQHLYQQGVWVPLAGRGQVQQRTHPHMLQALKVEDPIRYGRFRAGGVCAFNPNMTAVRELLQRWRELAWDQTLLSPPGSNNSNHRYDQSLLTIILGQSDLVASDDEIDISSSQPIAFLRTRNKVASQIPLQLDPLLRLYFLVYRYIDVILWKWRDRQQR